MAGTPARAREREKKKAVHGEARNSLDFSCRVVDIIEALGSIS